MLCNTATFREDSENLLKPIIHRQCDGDASETAILKFMEASVSVLLLFEFNLYIKYEKNKTRLEVFHRIVQPIQQFVKFNLHHQIVINYQFILQQIMMKDI
jgi:hypothetical protein